MAAMDQIAIQLHRALESGILPAEGRAAGQKLMTQLKQPTRIAVIGFEGSGKTSLINMLLGGRLMPDFDGVTSVDLSFGDTARAQLTMDDGTIRSKNGILEPSGIPKGTLRVSQQLPDTRLREWGFVEVSLSQSAADHGLLLDWMAKRSDIVVWCSQKFDDRESALWANVPEHLKDHSVLALTRADRLYMKGELAERIAALQPIVADEFLGLYPLATLQASAAQRSGGGNGALWQSSGGKAFYDGIRQQVDLARMADLDHAHLFLRRYKVPVPDQSIAQANNNAVDQSAPVVAAPKPPLATQIAKVAPARKSNSDDVMRTAFRLLQDCADDLMNGPDLANGSGADRILERCGLAAEELVQLLTDQDDPRPELKLIREDAIEGEQMLMLLRLERGETASEDALTVLLQLKKEMSERYVQ